MAATDFVTETQIDSLVTTIATNVKSNTTAHNNHLADAVDAHDASAISVADVGALLTATDVEAALAEIIGAANTAQTTADNHIADATAAHAASAISIVDTGAYYTATDVEAALEEVRIVADAAAGGGVSINDTATNTTQAWSSQKITDEIAASTAALINSAPAALDTLDELAAALGDDANFASTMTTALSLRVRVDAAQAFTGPQQLQGRQNIGVISSVVDFAAAFTAALA